VEPPLKFLWGAVDLNTKSRKIFHEKKFGSLENSPLSSKFHFSSCEEKYNVPTKGAILLSVIPTGLHRVNFFKPSPGTQ
jgi:hypothetical protein